MPVPPAISRSGVESRSPSCFSFIAISSIRCSSKRTESAGAASAHSAQNSWTLPRKLFEMSWTVRIVALRTRDRSCCTSASRRLR